MLRTMKEYFAINSTTAPYCHGFLKGRSTTTNLLEFACHVFKAFSKDAQLDAIYTDLSKVFNISSEVFGRFFEVLFNSSQSNKILVI